MKKSTKICLVIAAPIIIACTMIDFSSNSNSTIEETEQTTTIVEQNTTLLTEISATKAIVEEIITEEYTSSQKANIIRNTTIKYVEPETELTTIQTTKPITELTTNHTTEKETLSGEKVYITPTGSKYHNCECGNGTYNQVSIEEAKNMGLTPCSKCYQ